VKVQQLFLQRKLQVNISLGQRALMLAPSSNQQLGRAYMTHHQITSSSAQVVFKSCRLCHNMPCTAVLLHVVGLVIR